MTVGVAEDGRIQGFVFEVWTQNVTEDLWTRNVTFHLVSVTFHLVYVKIHLVSFDLTPTPILKQINIIFNHPNSNYYENQHLSNPLNFPHPNK